MQKLCISFKPFSAGVKFIPPQPVRNSFLNKDMTESHILNLNFTSDTSAVESKVAIYINWDASKVWVIYILEEVVNLK